VRSIDPVAKFSGANHVQSLQPNICNSLAPQQREAIATGNGSRLPSQEEREAGIYLDALDESFSCG
jgi:hypothetical protein